MNPDPNPKPRDIPAPKSAPRDIRAPENAPRDIPAPESAPRDSRAPEGAPSDIAAPESAPGDLSARENAPRDIAAPENSNSKLERRYARALRLYPKAYRDERGPELMATLLDAADDHQPQLPALLLGALRAHAGLERRSIRTTLSTAARAAAVLLLVSSVASAPVQVAVHLAHGVPLDGWLLDDWLPDLASTPVGLVALIAALRGRYQLAAALAMLAFGVGTVLWAMNDSLANAFLQYLVAAGLLLPLTRHAPRPAAGLLKYLPLLPLVLIGVDQLASNVFTDIVGRIGFVSTVAVCLGAVVWAVVDERVTLAIGLTYLTHFLLWIFTWVVFSVQSGGGVQSLAALAFSLLFYAGGPTLLLGAAAIATRRQVRL